MKSAQNLLLRGNSRRMLSTHSEFVDFPLCFPKYTPLKLTDSDIHYTNTALSHGLHSAKSICAKSSFFEKLSMIVPKMRYEVNHRSSYATLLPLLQRIGGMRVDATNDQPYFELIKNFKSVFNLLTDPQQRQHLYGAMDDGCAAHFQETDVEVARNFSNDMLVANLSWVRLNNDAENPEGVLGKALQETEFMFGENVNFRVVLDMLYTFRQRYSPEHNLKRLAELETCGVHEVLSQLPLHMLQSIAVSVRLLRMEPSQVISSVLETKHLETNSVPADLNVAEAVHILQKVIIEKMDLSNSGLVSVMPLLRGDQFRLISTVWRYETEISFVEDDLQPFEWQLKAVLGTKTSDVYLAGEK